jgi:preprotein translocase subunit SecA
MLGLNKLFGTTEEKYIKRISPTVEKINELEKEASRLKDEDFPKKTEELRIRIAKGESLDDIAPEAFSLVREAARRAIGLRHFDVQLIGGMVLHERKISEMKTGEGKTLVATLPAYLNALEGKGVHVVTVNDYLANRDAVWMGKIYNFLGLKVGVINDLSVSYIYDPEHKEANQREDELGSFKVVHEHLRPCSRQEAYKADITYGTNHQFGFDYLRDNLATDISQVVQREHHYAIVDEIDSILIDEARTPLIISGETGESESLYVKFATIAKKLLKDEDYKVDEKLKAITLTDAGIEKAEKLLDISNIYTEKGIKYVHHLETAVRAQALYLLDRDYVVKNGEVVIVDTFTGRLQPGRRWSEGLHQAIEAKEGMKIQKETRAIASITLQNYFRLYKKLSGMTGTAKTSEEEFLKVYGLEVVSIPTNLPVKRIDRNDLIFRNQEGKFKALAKKVKELQEKGQPVLIGTVSIEKNEMLSAYLKREGVRHTVLNAKNHESEGEIIAQAGRRGAVTVATNMAGRGVDIKLGGKPSTAEEYEAIKNLGGLFVLGTERHEARRIDNQLRGRSGRQGDSGETQFYVSLEDDLMRIFGGEGVKNMMARLGVPEDQAIESRIITRTLERAQTKIEGFHFDSRKHTLEYDDVMNHQRKVVYARRRVMLESNEVAIRDFYEGLAAIFTEEEKEKIESKRKQLSDPEFWSVVRRIALYVTDTLWTEHLETMEYLRSSVNLRAYGQRDPLIEYKKEGLRLFKAMEESFKEQVIHFLSNIDIEAAKAKAPKEEMKAIEAHKEEGQFEPERNMTGKKIGRNDPCYCGSGKKFKKCHGA